MEQGIVEQGQSGQLKDLFVLAKRLGFVVNEQEKTVDFFLLIHKSLAVWWNNSVTQVNRTSNQSEISQKNSKKTAHALPSSTKEEKQLQQTGLVQIVFDNQSHCHCCQHSPVTYFSVSCGHEHVIAHPRKQ